MRRLGMLPAITLAFVACSSDAATSPGPPGTKTFTALARDHVGTHVEYPQTPPVGGRHSPAWQDCQFYETSIPNERAVHSIERGAVWITYSPDLSATDRQALRNLASTGDHILISAYDGLPSPVVATAWGRQLQLQSVNDPDLALFVDVFQGGRQSPEPDGTCRDGTIETA